MTIPTEGRSLGRVRGAESVPDLLLCKPTDPFLELGISPKPTTVGNADTQRDMQGTGDKREALLDGERNRDRHADAYATLDDR